MACSGVPEQVLPIVADAGFDGGPRDAGAPEAGAHDAGAPDAGLPDAGVDAGCFPELPLTVVVGPHGPVRAYAHVRYEGRDVALLVDTGSQVTFLSTNGGPD